MVYPCECTPNLETYFLSNNKLFEMIGKRPDRFGKLFASYSKLRVINLANNRLGEIPKHMFKHNKELVKIDISFNQLEQLHFNLVDLHYLRVLDVSNNNIKVLDEISINNLNAVPGAGSNIYVDEHCIVVMKSNPLLCSTCDCKSSIQWLLQSMEFHLEQQALVCMSDDGTFRKIEKSVVKRIQNICNRKLVIITSTVCIIVTIITLCIIGIILHRRMRRLKRKRKLKNVLARLKEGEGQYEFVAFLSYSSDDYQFVHDHVIDQLNENLQLIIETDRRLLCTGDQDVRLGFNVPDETVLCLNRVSVVNSSCVRYILSESLL
ncbi:toll-like receptor 4 [Ruditapes philippinarum]|uniref:toll-like receptor 4 n=1 Tax=Ruditapes philippinarum TaxID=129788 RepID=UPI00295B3214|nr:toll-like receptor 4 [Ruditapes philippinarum]